MEEIRVVTLYDEENDTQTDFELVDTIESDGKTYWLVAELPEEDDEDEDEDEENIGAWLFAVCDRSEAELSATLDGQEVYVTSMLSDEEYKRVYQLFMQSEEYDLEIEEEEV